MELAGKKITLGITGGISSYKSAELARLLVKEGAAVRVVMTKAATHFVTPTTFQALSGNSVFSDQWDSQTANSMAHIELSRSADLLLVAPATANFIAKIANGLADDLLSTLVLARNCPLAVAPAMNHCMWSNPATQRNMAVLHGDSISVFGPASGDQACGETGEGRMLESAAIAAKIIAHFQPKVLSGKKVLLTAGPTFEAIDTVRGLTNLSSGKMGFALARAAQEAGADVTMICGPVGLDTPQDVVRLDIRSALEMHTVVMNLAAKNDVFISVAAVADYRPKMPAEHKIKKDTEAGLTVELIQNPDILAAVAALANPPLCVGFAAESQNLAEYAEKKRKTKNIPLIVGNLITDGFGTETNRVSLFDEIGETQLPAGGKLMLARMVVQHIVGLLEKR